MSHRHSESQPARDMHGLFRSVDDDEHTVREETFDECWNERERQYSLIVLLSRQWRQSSRGAIYYMVCVCAKELLAESERAVSEPQCQMGADSDNEHDLPVQSHRITPSPSPVRMGPTFTWFID
jgi:hypothetical protein